MSQPGVPITGGGSPDLIAIVSTFLMHAAARHITFDLTNAQKKLLERPESKIVILAALFYIR